MESTGLSPRKVKCVGRPDGSVGMALVLPALTDCRWWFESLAGPLGSLKCDPPKGNGRRPQKKRKVKCVISNGRVGLRRPDGSVGMALVLPALTDCRWWFESLLVHSGVSSATRRKATGADHKKNGRVVLKKKKEELK